MNVHKLYIDIERIVLNWRAYSCDNEFTSDIFHSAKNHFEELEADNREKDARIAELEAENAKLRTVLKDCADELEGCIDEDYKRGDGSIHPAMRRKYERDMATVRAARAALGESDGNN
jgi:TATA-binding protein-associated factor Taf7